MEAALEWNNAQEAADTNKDEREEASLDLAQEDADTITDAEDSSATTSSDADTDTEDTGSPAATSSDADDPGFGYFSKNFYNCWNRDKSAPEWMYAKWDFYRRLKHVDKAFGGDIQEKVWDRDGTLRNFRKRLTAIPAEAFKPIQGQWIEFKADLYSSSSKIHLPLPVGTNTDHWSLSIRTAFILYEVAAQKGFIAAGLIGDQIHLRKSYPLFTRGPEFMVLNEDNVYDIVHIAV
jgi:hypothetical protein